MNFDWDSIRAQMAPGWSAVNIILMVVLFWIFWPLGLAMVAYIVWGDRAGLDLGQPQSFSGFGSRLKRSFSAAADGFNSKNSTSSGTAGTSGTGTPSLEKERFEKWRQEEKDKLAAERQALEKEKRALDEARKVHEENS